MNTLETRFWKYVDRRGDSDCWNWTGDKIRDGYGRIWNNGKTRRAHRISWELRYGEVPENMCVLHHCDNPSCVNPAHLYLGTNQDNVNDKVAKSRQAVGINNGGNKYPPEKILEIKRLRQDGKTQREIAKTLGVSKGLVYYVITGQVWRNL